MKSNRQVIQLSLISIGFLLILATYFLYPKIKEKKFEDTAVGGSTITASEKEDSLFENVEYQGLYSANNPFTVKSEKAYILTKEPDIVFMSEMLVTLHTNNGKIVTITSDKGRYNKVTYDIYFEDNVRATDDETIILAENLDLLATEDSATVYNNVVLTNEKGTLRADKVDYDFETRRYHISMFNDKKVKIKLIK